MQPSHLLEDISMGPLSRWKKYRRIPARFITQIALLAVLIWHVVEVTRMQNAFNRVWLRNFVGIVYPRGRTLEARRKRHAMFGTADPDEKLHHVSFFEINATAVAEQLQYATSVYYSMWDEYVDEVCVANRPCIEKDGDPVEPLRLEYALLSKHGEMSVIDNVTSARTLGPFSVGRTRSEYEAAVQDTTTATLRLFLKIVQRISVLSYGRYVRTMAL